MWHQYVKKFAQKLVFTMPVAVAFLDCVAYVARVEGISMQPALNPEETSHDYVLLNKWSVRQFDITHGDIVAIVSPKNPEQKIIKRVIAKEGDVVRTLSYKRRYVYVPQGHCWVEGDHHQRSMDSNIFGPIALGLITAKASHIVWPPSRWRKLLPELPKDHRLVTPAVQFIEDTEEEELDYSDYFRE